MPPSSRRGFFILAAGAGLGWAGSAWAANACFDMTKLPGGDRSLRQSFNFKEVSGDPRRSCSGCAFFTADQAAPSCGKCALLSGGPVTAGSVCDNWAAKK